MYVKEKLFCKSCLLRRYGVRTASPAGEMSIQSKIEYFSLRVAEKRGRKNFAEHIGAREDKARLTKELEPFLEEFKRAAEKKIAELSLE